MKGKAKEKEHHKYNLQKLRGKAKGQKRKEIKSLRSRWLSLVDAYGSFPQRNVQVVPPTPAAKSTALFQQEKRFTSSDLNIFKWFNEVSRRVEMKQDHGVVHNKRLKALNWYFVDFVASSCLFSVHRTSQRLLVSVAASSCRNTATPAANLLAFFGKGRGWNWWNWKMSFPLAF